MTRVEKFRDWIERSRTGKIYIYHSGYLARDRGRIVDYADSGEAIIEPNGDIDDLANIAIDAFVSGRVHLFQRKIHDNQYQYIAMKRRAGDTGGRW